MKLYVLTIWAALSIISCSESKKSPDVSNIKVNLEVQRFDQDLFNLDTSNMQASLVKLQQRYPSFLKDFMDNILGIPIEDPEAPIILKQYIKEFQPVYALTQKKFADFSLYSKEVIEMLKLVKYYFPNYPLPKKLIPFIGPMDAFYQSSLGWSGDIITSEGLGIGLQLHLGKDADLYAEAEGRGYPAYISKRFEPEYIIVNTTKNVIDDIHPMIKDEETLINQFIDKGKRLYVLNLLLPTVHDSLKIGYTGKQLEASEKNEGLIWTYFLENNLLFEKDFQKIKPFLTEGPKTQELGDESPGFIGLFVGKKIVEQFMEKHPELTVSQLLEYDNQKLFEDSKYKPKR